MYRFTLRWKWHYEDTPRTKSVQVSNPVEVMSQFEFDIGCDPFHLPDPDIPRHMYLDWADIRDHHGALVLLRTRHDISWGNDGEALD